MQFLTTSIALALLASAAHAIPTQAPCNPNPHGRICGAVLIGAAGVESTIDIPFDFQTHPTDVSFSVSQIYQPDNGQYEVVTLYGIDGSVTTVQPGQTVAVGPPQVQTSAFCTVVCPS
jgi:hypothetical protein